MRTTSSSTKVRSPFGGSRMRSRTRLYGDRQIRSLERHAHCAKRTGLRSRTGKQNGRGIAVRPLTAEVGGQVGMIAPSATIRTALRSLCAPRRRVRQTRPARCSTSALRAPTRQAGLHMCSTRPTQPSSSGPRRRRRRAPRRSRRRLSRLWLLLLCLARGQFPASCRKLFSSSA